jgi:hypothetical protein
MLEELDSRIGSSKAPFRIASAGVTTYQTVAEDEALQIIEAWGVETHAEYVYDLVRLKRKVGEHEAVKMISEGTFKSD